jgi:TetR/AcrR family transcriptional regulator, regulator of cefoperazone and chloramphenicol sensitivity
MEVHDRVTDKAAKRKLGRPQPASQQAATRRPAKRPGRLGAGGYERGEETRLRIIVAALDVFGALGFEETSTRAIADRAGVNLAALHYYFAGKDGVYRACAEHIASYGEQMIGPFLAQIETSLANPRLTRRQLCALLRNILDGFADRLVSPRDPPSWVNFVLREQMSPTAAYGVLNERVTGRLIGGVAGLVGRLIERPAQAEETILRTLAMFGPLMVFRRARDAALLALGWPDFAGERLSLIKAVQWDQALGALGLRAEPGDAAPRTPQARARQRKTT